MDPGYKDRQTPPENQDAEDMERDEYAKGSDSGIRIFSTLPASALSDLPEFGFFGILYKVPVKVSFGRGRR